MIKTLRIRLTRLIRSFSRVRLTAALVLSVALVVLGVAQASASTADEPDMNASDFAAVDRYVQKEMEATRLPGLALGIIKGDRIVHLKGFGEADDSGRKVTPETPFLLGSSTKSITALATMQLVESGKVELDAPVQRYVPWFRVASSRGGWRRADQPGGRLGFLRTMHRSPLQRVDACGESRVSAFLYRTLCCCFLAA